MKEWNQNIERYNPPLQASTHVIQVNALKMQQKLLHLKTQVIPCCKHFPYQL
jgi:hypothetical protein